MENIVLVGFMGTGKTVVANRVAEKLKMRYVNLDNIIEEKEGRPIREIFIKDGEKYFREAEKAATKEVSVGRGLVIATGGGVVMDSENVENLKKNGVMICLTADPEIILKRTAHMKHRPLLDVDDPEAKIRELLAYRESYYRRADYTINTSSLTISEVVDRVIHSAS